MAITTPTDKTVFRPLTGAITRRFTVGATAITGGMVVSLGSAGLVATDGNSGVLKPIGIALKSAAAGERVDVVVFGPVNGYTGCTIGDYIGADNTTIGLALEVTTAKYAVGQAESATAVFVNPGYIA